MQLSDRPLSSLFSEFARGLGSKSSTLKGRRDGAVSGTVMSEEGIAEHWLFVRRLKGVVDSQTFDGFRVMI